ncbi:polyribonucleotide nucleotidyltransferase [Patescibacteria group bacterium]|nr:polyribonucleotide nucleotidyltransferase [Patescibacteria group bacterium]
MNSKVIENSINISNQELTLQTGKLAEQANGAVLASHGDSTLLATVVFSDSGEDRGYLPLIVDYEEKFYAGGRIKGSRFVKREGRPSELAILKARAIDRSIRPLFPKDLRSEIQIIVTILSFEPGHDLTFLALTAVSAALKISGLPWKGPVAAVKIGLNDGNYLLNPRGAECEFSDLDLLLVVSRESMLMLEVKAEQSSEEKVIGAVQFAQPHLETMLDFIEDFTSKVDTPVVDYKPPEIDLKVKAQVISFVQDNFPEDGLHQDHSVRDDAQEEFRGLLFEKFEGKIGKSQMNELFDDQLKLTMRRRVLESNKRFDGRALDEVRPLEIEIGLLPRVHGSALFKRGQTQVLSVVTLASTSLEQLIETMTGETTQRYIHHYEFLPFSTGECGRLGYPRRREIGHGALAETALLPVIPSEKEFPYTVRVVSEVLSSAGSTSQASVCGSSLSLMDAGVPIKAAVAGVAMGLISEGDKNLILTDIAGLEDFYGDMDLKVAGTESGITAMQMDVKTGCMNMDLLTKALKQARTGRLHILQEMSKVISSSREKLSEYAPHIITVKVNPSKIGKIIGPGGGTIRAIQEETETEIDVRDDGRVMISGRDLDKVEQAQKWVASFDQEAKIGEIYDGKVTRVLDFGAFVEILPRKEGMVHISEITDQFIDKIHDHIKEGDKVRVKVINIDDRDRINLSIKQAK